MPKAIKQNNIACEENDTRCQILKVAENFFAAAGYFGTALNQIAKEVNIKKASLYYYFDSKQEIFEEVIKNSFNELDKSLAKITSSTLSNKEKINEITLTYLKIGSKHGAIILAAKNKFSQEEELAIIKLVKKLKQETINKIEPILTSNVKNIKKLSQGNMKTAALLYLGMMDSFLLNYIIREKKSNYEDVAKIINNWLFD